MRLTALASVILAILSFTGLYVVPVVTEPLADMYLEPTAGVVKIGDTFTISVMASARTPVNVFKGGVRFDPSIITVESINYNTSIADLWAEKPWYENGEGTINFIGGTTRQGGFTGKDTLITITFRSQAQGDALIHIYDMRILEHDGLGTDVTLGKPIDALFMVEEEVLAETVTAPADTAVLFAVRPAPPSTDVNGDGSQTIVDISIFMLNMFGEDPRFDFNVDGEINNADLSIIMSAK